MKKEMSIKTTSMVCFLLFQYVFIYSFSSQIWIFVIDFCRSKSIDNVWLHIYIWIFKFIDFCRSMVCFHLRFNFFSFIHSYFMFRWICSCAWSYRASFMSQSSCFCVCVKFMIWLISDLNSLWLVLVHKRKNIKVMNRES